MTLDIKYFVTVAENKTISHYIVLFVQGLPSLEQWAKVTELLINGLVIVSNMLFPYKYSRQGLALHLASKVY